MKVGDKIKVVSDDNVGHGYEIGSVLTVKKYDSDGYVYVAEGIQNCIHPEDYVSLKSEKITLTDLEDIIDEIRELEETSDHLHTEALEEKLRFIRRALINVQVQQKSYMEAIELYTNNLNKSIG